jgi:hypothetical protein
LFESDKALLTASSVVPEPLVSERVRSIVLTAEFLEIEIPIHQACAELHILGE